MRNQKAFTYLLLFACMAILPFFSHAQKKEVLQGADSSKTVTTIIDTAASGKKVEKTKVYSPKVAATRSAILPGWGQAYNKKYWKIPIVYGALGTTAGIFIYNLNWYKRTKYAYGAVVDPVNYPPAGVHEDLQFLVARGDATSLQYLKNEYRKTVDYAALFFLLMWGLNVVDAAVDAHLKAFDVSDDLSFRFKPGYSEIAGTNGLSLVFSIGNKKPTTLLPSRF